MLNCNFCRHSLTRVTHNKKKVNLIHYCLFENPDFHEEDVEYCRYYDNIPYNPLKKEILKPIILLKESVLKIPVMVRTDIHMDFLKQEEFIILDEVIVEIEGKGITLVEISNMEEYVPHLEIITKKLNYRLNELCLTVK